MLKREYKYCSIEFKPVNDHGWVRWCLHLNNSNKTRVYSEFDVKHKLTCFSQGWIPKAEIRQRQLIGQQQRSKLMDDFFHFIGPSYSKVNDFDEVYTDLEYLFACVDNSEYEELEEIEIFKRGHPELFNVLKNFPEETREFFAKFQSAYDSCLVTRRYNGYWKPKEEWEEMKVILETALQDFKNLPSLHDSQDIQEATPQG